MKTAISIPDETFARAESHAAALGCSRSEFFTRAVRRYMEQIEAESLTGRINAAVDMAWPTGVTIDVAAYRRARDAVGPGRGGERSGGMAIGRGDVCRAGPGDHRPVLVIQAQPYNDSRLPTVLAASITADTRLATMPGSVFLTTAVSGLDRDAVVEVTTLLTLSRSDLGDPVGTVPAAEMAGVDAGLRQVLGL